MACTHGCANRAEQRIRRCPFSEDQPSRPTAVPQFTEMRRPALWDDRRPSSRSWGNGRSTVEPVSRRTVVLGYDGSEGARSATLHAAEAAGRGGHIVVVTSMPYPDASLLEPEADRAGDPAQLLEEAEALLECHEVHVTTRVEWSDPTEALVAVAYETDADLIVVGARGRSFLMRALRGSVAERLVTRAPCTVLVARPKGIGRRWGHKPIGVRPAPRHSR